MVTTNFNAALEVLKDVAKIGEGIPYLEGIAGLLSTLLKTKEVSRSGRPCQGYNETTFLFRKWMHARMNGRMSRAS